MKARALLCLLSIVGLAFVTSSRAEDKEDPLAGVTCPVSGKDINPEATAEYRDGKVYFCCPGCPKAFANNTEKFAAKANHQLVATGQYTQKACPLTGKPSKEDKTVEVSNVTVEVCCPGCLGKATKAEDKIDLLFNDKVFEKGFEKASAQ
jgi:YHS domain-containing protein